jgi:hypothetical protein
MDTPRGTWVGYVPMGAQFNVDGHWNIFEINLRQIAAPGSRNMTYVGMLRELPGSYAPPSRGGTPQYYWLHSPPKTSIDRDILARTDALLKNETCKKFLNAMLAELGRITGRGREGVSFGQLFEAARGSIYSSPNLNSRGNAGQQLIGHPGFNIEILIRPTVPTDTQAAPTSIMHEIFHDAPGSGEQYNHTDMARAAFAVADAMGMTKDHDYPLQLGQQPKPFEGTNDQKTAADNWNSSLFQQILVHACR